MRKKYLAVEFAIILFNEQDVLTSSSSGLLDEREDSNDVMGDDPYGGF